MPARTTIPRLTGYQKSARISACGMYRFTLFRGWNTRPLLLVVLMNPSTANHKIDDPTVTLLMHIAAHNGYGGIVVVNLCPLRSPTMASAFTFLDRVNGNLLDEAADWAMRENLEAIEDALEQCAAVLIGWGSQGWRAQNWYARVDELIREAAADGKPIFRLGVCANGHPMHPLARGKHRLSKTAPLLALTY